MVVVVLVVLAFLAGLLLSTSIEQLPPDVPTSRWPRLVRTGRQADQ